MPHSSSLRRADRYAAETAAKDTSRQVSRASTVSIRESRALSPYRSTDGERVSGNRVTATQDQDCPHPESSTRVLPFRFTGEVGEYFRIWVVNVSLTIVSLGIYSAWAKVRTKRSFYGNTLLDDCPFDYDAKPIAILKGRLIAVAVIAFYAVSINFYPVTEPLFLLAFALLLPWLLVKAFAFRARHSSYRNVRFGFVGTYRGALGMLFRWGLLTALTLGLAYPAFIAHRTRFLIDRTDFGSTRLSFTLVLKDFYRAYFGAVLLALAIMILGMGATVAIHVHLYAGVEEPPVLMVSQLLMVPISLILVLVFHAYLKAKITNIVFEHTEFGAHRFRSTLRAREMIWLYLSNAVAIACSFGLLVPWARIRLARYRAEHLKLLAASDLDGFVAVERQTTAAAGEELSDLLDIDVGV